MRLMDTGRWRSTDWEEDYIEYNNCKYYKSNRFGDNNIVVTDSLGNTIYELDEEAYKELLLQAQLREIARLNKEKYLESYKKAVDIFEKYDSSREYFSIDVKNTSYITFDYSEFIVICHINQAILTVPLENFVPKEFEKILFEWMMKQL